MNVDLAEAYFAVGHINRRATTLRKTGSAREGDSHAGNLYGRRVGFVQRAKGLEQRRHDANTGSKGRRALPSEVNNDGSMPFHPSGAISP